MRNYGSTGTRIGVCRQWKFDSAEDNAHDEIPHWYVTFTGHVWLAYVNSHGTWISFHGSRAIYNLTYAAGNCGAHYFAISEISQS